MMTRGVRENAVKFLGAAALFCFALLLAIGGAAEKDFFSVDKAGGAAAANTAGPGTAKQNSHWAEAYGRLPLSFEENQGQTAREVRFVSHGSGYELFLTPQEAVLTLRSNEHLDFSPRHRSAYLRTIREQNRLARSMQTAAIRIHFEGANPHPQILGADRLPTRVNYFTGSDPKNWHTDIPAYSRVRYQGIYPGVDLIFYGNRRRLEYDFVVAPGAAPEVIQLKIDGARRMRVNAHGDLILTVADGELTLQKPLIYQQVSGEKREIAGNFVLAGDHRVAFSVAGYDRRAPLILDPVLDYSTYLGGSADENTALPVGIAVDSAGDAFVAGQTFSTNFPTTISGIGGPDPTTTNNGASFVAELNPAGTQLLYAAYLVGTTTNPGDGATAVAVDSTGKVYVTGVTFAAGFPQKNALPPAANTVGGICYVTKLDPTQTVAANSLLFSTYLGGTGAEICNGIAVDANANAYVVGQTLSTNFPVSANPYQNTFNLANAGNAHGSAFLSRIDTTAFTLVYSTYLSGNAANAATAGSFGFGDQAFGVAADASNNAYIVGQTTSNNSSGFPSSPNANQTAPPVANVHGATFVTKINTAASTGPASFVYSTYVAGSAQDFGYGLALGPTNLAYVTGGTQSNDFPFTTGAFDTAGTGAGKAFLTVVDTTNTTAGSPFHYSTPLGAGGGDTGFGIKVDGSGNAYIVGTTASATFPLTPGPLQSSRLNPSGNVFVAKLAPGGNGSADLLYSTYFGGSGNGSGFPDQGYAIAIDSANPPNAYITGQTHSTDIPILTPLPGEGALKGPSDAYVAKLTLIPTLTVTPSPFSFGTQTVGVASSPQAFTVTNNTANAASLTSIVVNGVSPASNTDFKISTNGCGASVGAGLTCQVSVTFTPSVVAAESATLVITATVTNGGQNSTDVLNVSLTGTGAAPAPAVTLTPTSLTFGNQTISTTSAAMPVTLTNSGTAALTINTIAASGDFAATSTGATACPISPSTLAAGANCTINVTFTPTATGTRNGTLSVTDNATGSPHTVSLTGTGTAAAAPAVTLAPTSLTFGNQTISTTSAAKPVTLTNTGTAALTINTIAASGDFAATSTGATACPISPSTLAAGANCTINVTFTPTATGTRNGTLSVTDNAAGSPHTVSLTGTGTATPDFSLTAAPTSVTVSQGAVSSAVTITVNPSGGFSSAVALTCTGAPTNSSCMVSPSSITAPTTASLTFTAHGMFVPVPISKPAPPLNPLRIVPLIAALMLIFLLRSTQRFRTRLAMVCVILICATLAACSGPNNGSSKNTAKGTYTLTVTGTSGNLSHNTAVSVTVN